TSADIARAMPKPEPPKPEPPKPELSKPPAAKVEAPPAPPPPLELGKPEPPPPPPTSTELARGMPDPDGWPSNRTEQIRATQGLLRDLKLMDIGPTGHVGPLTIAAIRDYQRMAGQEVTGEASKALFESLKETRAMMERKASGKSR